MKPFLAVLFLLFGSPGQVISVHAPGVHLPLYRRGGTFSNHHQPANLTYLSQVLTQTERRFARTYTDVEGNRIVRRWLDGPHGADDYLLDSAGLGGSWYTTLQIGTPPQTLEVDIDMLSPDFYTIMTTSGKGSKYDTFASSSHEPTQEQTHPTCLKTTDILHIPILQSSSSPDADQKLTTTPLRTPFPICQPPKYTHQTLYPSGSILGLSPTTNTHNSKDRNKSPLSRLASPSLLSHLLSSTIITHPIIHITLLTATTGLLTLGHPPIYTLEKTKVTLEKQLDHITSSPSDPASDLTREIDGAMAYLVPEWSTPDTLFIWTDSGNGGVKGWHGAMMGGVWVNGVKVLRNQMVVFDVNCPVVLAPVGVGGVVFEAGGGREVGSLLGRGDGDCGDGKKFWAYPCLNPPVVEFEIGGWRFPVSGRDGFGLGRVDVSKGDGEDDEDEQSGTGYCVGIIVETDMGGRPRWIESGMTDVWVLGEPFFRGVGVAFDFGGADGKGVRVGVRRN